MKILILNNKKLNCQRFVVFTTLFVFGASKSSAYAPLTDGWWRLYSRWISEGLLPYKDFNLIVPPGMPYIDLFFSKIVGQNFYSIRLVGVILGCLIAITLFEILRKLIASSFAMLLSIVGIVTLYSTEVVLTFDYNYFSIFFLILTVKLWQISEESRISSRKALIYSVLSGIVLGCSLFIKLNFGIYFMFFYGVTEIVRIFLIPRSDFRIIYVRVLSKFAGLFFAIFMLSSYFISKQAFLPMINSLFLDSPRAKGSSQDILFNWMIYLKQNYSLRKELFFSMFFFLSYVALEKYFLPKMYNTKTNYVKIRNLSLNIKYLRISYFSVALIYILVSVINLREFSQSGTEQWIITLSNQIAYILIPHTFVLPVVSAFLMFFWSLKKVNQNWIPLLTLCLTLIWGAGSSGGLNWYATSIPLVTFFAWLSTKTEYREFFTVITAFFAIAISTSLYASWINSPYNWWSYKTPAVFFANSVSDSGLTKGLHMDAFTQQAVKSIEGKLAEVKDCDGGLMVFPHMPIFQLDLNSQPQRRDGIYWFDFITQKNVQNAISEIKKNPPAGFAIVNVPAFVWDGHSKAFNDGKIYKQRRLISTLLNEAQSGYSSFNFRLYKVTGEWSVNVYTRDSCKVEE